jgi:hypothetical protein
MVSGFYTPDTTSYRLWPNNLNTTYFTNSQTAGVRPLVSGTAPPLLNQQEGRGNLCEGDPTKVLTMLSGTQGPPPPGYQAAIWGACLGISDPYGITPMDCDDKPHIPLPETSRTPDAKPFTSGPEALSHSLCVGNTRDSGTWTFSTKEGPTASSTNVPSEKDEHNSALTHLGQLGWAAMLQKHRLPSERTTGIGTPHLEQPIAQGKRSCQGRPAPQGSHL